MNAAKSSVFIIGHGNHDCGLHVAKAGTFETFESQKMRDIKGRVSR